MPPKLTLTNNFVSAKPLLNKQEILANRSRTNELGEVDESKRSLLPIVGSRRGTILRTGT